MSRAVVSRRRASRRKPSPQVVVAPNGRSLTPDDQLAILATVFANSPDGMAFIDSDYVIRQANRAYSEQVHQSLESLIGRRLEEAFPGWAEQVAHIYGKVRETGKPFHAQSHPFIFGAEPERGITFWDVSVSPVRGRGRRFLGFLVQHHEVTDRKRAEEALIESAQHYRRIVETATEGIWILDAENRTTFVNARMAEMLGYIESEMIGQPVFKFMDEESVALAKAKLQRRHRGTPGQEDFKFRRKDGSYLWTIVSSNPIFDGGGRYTGSLGMVTDITRRKLAEEKLRAANRELEITSRIVNNSPDMISVVDRHYTYRKVNPMYGEVFQKPSSEIEGHAIGEFLGRRVFRESIRPLIDRAFNGELIRFERWFDFPIGRRYMVVRYFPLPGEAGTELVMIVARDVTERKRGEGERQRLLDESQRRASELQAVLDNMVDGVVVVNAQREIVLANSAILKLLGFRSIGQMLGKMPKLASYLRLRHPDGKPLTSDEMAMTQALEGEIVTNQDEVMFNRMTRKEVFVRVSAAPIKLRDENVSGAIIVIKDVTDIIDMNRLKDQFITVAAHELKTPIGIMKGYAQALLRTVEDMPPERRWILDAINRGADRIDRIVQDLLDISRLTRGELELAVEGIDLAELAEEVVHRMALTTTKHRMMLSRLEPVIVQGDRARLEQVLSDLIDNAIRYSPKGGDIQVEVTVKDKKAIVSVKDQGVGITKEKQERIFERFYRAHTGTMYDYGGLGIALYMAKEVISRHGGKLWFESVENGGSTFHFSLPLRGQSGESQ